MGVSGDGSGKNSARFFFDDVEAGSNIAGFYTFIATYEARGITPFGYLTDVIARVQDHPAQRLDELLLTRYFGVFAARAKLRRAVVPGYGAAHEGGCCPPEAQPAMASAEPARESLVTARRRMAWSKLLMRVFAVDVLRCPRCESRLQRVEVCTSARSMAAGLSGREGDTGPPVQHRAA